MSAGTSSARPGCLRGPSTPADTPLRPPLTGATRSRSPGPAPSSHPRTAEGRAPRPEEALGPPQVAEAAPTRSREWSAGSTRVHGPDDATVHRQYRSRDEGQWHRRPQDRVLRRQRGRLDDRLPRTRRAARNLRGHRDHEGLHDLLQRSGPCSRSGRRPHELPRSLGRERTTGGRHTLPPHRPERGWRLILPRRFSTVMPGLRFPLDCPGGIAAAEATGLAGTRPSCSAG